MKTKYMISELFSSIQGESSYAGWPCFFIRLAGCNLNCTYCDTQYAGKSATGKEYTLARLLEQVKAADIPLVEITGGEPLLQKGVPKLCRKLLDEKYQVLVETNGSISIASLPEEAVKIVDCKCPSSGHADQMDFANFALLSWHDEVKFVIVDRDDYEYALKIIKRYDLKHKIINIILSPDLSRPGLAAKLAEWILADHAPVRMQLQLHKCIWDPSERGR